MSAPAPTTTASSLLSDTLDFFNVLHDPVGVYNRVKERPRILGPWIVLSIAFVVITFLTRPYQQAAMDAFKATLTPEQAARMGDRGAGGGPVGLVLTPLNIYIVMAIGAGALWMTVSVSGTQARFKTLMSVFGYATVTYVLFALVGILVLTMRGKASITGFADVRAPLGLDLLTPNASLFLGTFLNGINPFSIWGVWLTGTGISITHGTSRTSAIVATAGAYLICLLLMSLPTLLVGMLTRQ